MPNYSSKVTNTLSALTHSQKAVAVYVLENRESMAFATLDDAAMKIGVSTTTVIRFARALGYTGYSEMQKDIQSEMMDKASLPERITSAKGKVCQNKLLRETMNNDIANITETVAKLPEDALRATVKAIIQARRVHVLGMRSSFALAHYTASRLGQLRPNIHLVQSAGMIFPEELVGSSSEDICIAFLFPRFSKTTANLIMWLRTMGVRIVLFTSQSYHTVQSYGDIIIPCRVKGNSFKNSFAGPLCIINYLAAAVVLENPEAIGVLQQTEEFLKKGYYLGL